MDEEQPKTKAKAAIKPTRPVFGHLETEWMMELILRSDLDHQEHLLAKFIRGAEEPEVYERLLERVRAHVTLMKQQEGR